MELFKERISGSIKLLINEITRALVQTRFHDQTLSPSIRVFTATCYLLRDFQPS